jgi:hypothetical protein
MFHTLKNKEMLNNGDREFDLKNYGVMEDGLPNVGKMMNQGDTEFCMYDKTL